MRTEAQTRKLLDYLEDMNEGCFSNSNMAKPSKEFTYTSPITRDEDDEPVVYEGNEALAISTQLQMAIDTLEWVLEESMAVRPVENENELKHYTGRVMYGKDDKPMISDSSLETFVARLEGEV